MKAVMRPKIHLLSFAAALLALVALAAGCSFTEQNVSQEVEISIEGKEFEYSPSTLEVVAGQEVTLTFKNVGALEHDINFDHLPLEEGMVMAGGSSHTHEEGSEHEHNSDDEVGHEHEEGSNHEHAAESGHEEESEHKKEGEHMEEADHEAEKAIEPTLHAHTESGEQLTVTFTPTEPGTYEFYCSVPGHLEEGMVGKLVVNAP